MNIKKIIQVVIIVGAFGGAALVLYNGLVKGPTEEEAAQETAVTQPVTVEQILPYGDKLDFKGILSQRPLQFNTVDYPKLNAGAEVGIPEQSLITPLTTTTGKR